MNIRQDEKIALLLAISSSYMAVGLWDNRLWDNQMWNNEMLVSRSWDNRFWDNRCGIIGRGSIGFGIFYDKVISLGQSNMS